MTDRVNIKIAIASGKGGTGKTLLSTSLFYLLQRDGSGTTLVDCDAEEPNDMVFFKGDLLSSAVVNHLVPVIDKEKCTFCGRCHEYCNYNAIFILPPSRIINVIEDLCHGCGACSVACTDDAISEKEIPLGTVSRFRIEGGSEIIEARMNVGVYSPVSVIKESIREAGDEGIVILDSPPGTSCPFIQTVAPADYIILVTEPTPFGLSDLKQSVETLKTMDKRYGVVINRAGLGDRAIYSYLEQEKIKLLMEIPFDKDLASAYSKGDIAIMNNTGMQNQLLSMIETVIADVGNSSNKR